MEKVNKKIIIIALVLSLITAVLIYIYINASSQTVVVPEIEYTTVYVAAQDIPARTEINSEHVKKVKIAKELLNTSALADTDEIIGKRTKESIISGEQFLPQRLVNEDNMSLSYHIEEGTRAISINISEQVSVANLLRPGDYVDVVASFEKEEEQIDDELTKVYPKITKLILQNVQVLTLGQDMMLSADKLAEAPSTVTLAVEKEDVEIFVYISQFATLRLALRSVGDSSKIDTQGIIRSDTTGTKGVYTIDSDLAEQNE